MIYIRYVGMSTSDKIPGLAEAGGFRSIGRYSVVKMLGRGGMGEVCKAVDVERNCYVAIKTLDPDASRDADVLKRFEREARSAMTLDHPNVARMFGLEYDTKGQPFIVMEFIDGDPLDRHIKNHPELSYSQICDYMIQVARGLEAAHRRSIIHRDIKPANLVITPGNIAKIIDFGLAKSMWEKTMVTASGMVVGTPRYISPEQALGRTVDHRSDIYSLGATFYELVTRQCPFDGDTAMAIMMKHINAPLIAPYMINPQVPSDVNEIIVRMLEKDQGARYQDYEPLIRDLEAAKIHRLAKERRTPLVGDDGITRTSDTAILGEGGTTPRGSSYLTEGLVHVTFDDLDHAEKPSKTNAMLLTLLGVLILGGALAALFSQQTPASAEKKSPLGKAVSNLFAANRKPAEKEPTPEELAQAEADLFSQTRERIDVVLQKVIEYRKSHSTGGTPTIRQLRGAGVLSPEESQDAWGNDFIISSAHDGVLIAPGPDSHEGTKDDFIISLSGVEENMPQPRTAEEFAPPAKK